MLRDGDRECANQNRPADDETDNCHCDDPLVRGYVVVDEGIFSCRSGVGKRIS
jgi:hypothetical protein